jgi:hypothetical protein
VLNGAPEEEGISYDTNDYRLLGKFLYLGAENPNSSGADVMNA